MLAVVRVAIDVAPIRPLLDRIVARWDPPQIWLFGSRAQGRAVPDSDWDLLVVVPDQTPESELDPLIPWRLRSESGVRADIVACRRSEFSEDRSTPNTLAYEAATRGLLIHER